MILLFNRENATEWADGRKGMDRWERNGPSLDSESFRIDDFALVEEYWRVWFFQKTKHYKVLWWRSFWFGTLIASIFELPRLAQAFTSWMMHVFGKDNLCFKGYFVDYQENLHWSVLGGSTFSCHWQTLGLKKLRQGKVVVLNIKQWNNYIPFVSIWKNVWYSL